MFLANNGHKETSSKIIFITGGTKSGKSAFAEHLAKDINNLTYIALSEKRPNDKIWQKKISMHQKRRPQNWKLVETTNLIEVVSKKSGPMLIDSISGFVMENINKEDEEWIKKMHSLINILKKRTDHTFIVGEQVGWSLVSEYKIGNIFIERIGDLQKKITQISKDNWVAINGRAIKLDDISTLIPN